MFKLVICDDEGKITVVPMTRDEISVGRKEGNAIRLTDRNVSRHHARLYRDAAGDFFVVNLARNARTKVENIEVGVDPQRVKIGDQIYIGDYKLSIRTDAVSSIPIGTSGRGEAYSEIGKVLPIARLVMLKGPEPGREFELAANLYVIGRSGEANLNVDDVSISRAHARLDGDEQRWSISDLDSINGIQINGVKKDDYLLKSGDVIELGTVQFRFVAAGEPYTWAPSRAVVPPSKTARMLTPKRLILLSAWLLLLVVFLVLRLQSSAADDAASSELKNRKDDTSALLTAGRQAMGAQNWEEAARFFAEAQMRNPDDTTAHALKKQANKELFSQTALAGSMDAEAALNWQEAVDQMAKIPSDSFYYDRPRLQKLAAKLCDDLLYKADFMITAESPEAKAVLDQLGAVPEISDECRENRNRLLKLIVAPEL